MKRPFILLLSLFCCLSAFAQKEVRNQLRKGNTAYRDSLFVDAEVAYRKAIDAAPTQEVGLSYYNLGNTLMSQSKFQEAMHEYARAADVETDKGKQAQALHNMGVIFQADKQYDKAIEMYKRALRNNPKDDETRYNLALALQQKEQQDQDQEGKDENEDQDQNKDQDQQDQNEDQQDQNQDQQNQDNKQDEQQDQDQNQEGSGQNPQQLSKDAVDQMLEAILREEKKTQEKVQKQQVLRGKKKEKDW